MYRTGVASTVLVPCTHGVGLGSLTVCTDVNMMSLFEFCRLGVTVVSGLRETRPMSKGLVKLEWLVRPHVRADEFRVVSASIRAVPMWKP